MVCDPECQLRKKTIEEREEIERDAKTVPQPPPGDPVCTNGNPSLCPVEPTQPATVVGAQDDLTDETSDWSDQQHQNALNEVGSVVASVGTTGGYNWFTMGMGEPPMLIPPCRCGGGPGGGAFPIGGPVGGVGTPIAWGALGIALIELANSLVPQLGVIGETAGGAAQPPDEDDPRRDGDDDEGIPVNRKGEKYPQVTDPRTGKPIHYPGNNLKKIDIKDRVSWDSSENRHAYIKEWHDRGFKTPEGGWAKYDIHHIQPREYGGTNAFDNLVPVIRETHQKQFNPWWRNY